MDEVDQFLRIMEASGDRGHANAIRASDGNKVHTGALRAMLTRLQDSTPPYSYPTTIVELEYLVRQWCARKNATGSATDITQPIPAEVVVAVTAKDSDDDTVFTSVSEDEEETAFARAWRQANKPR